jgi:hypothetical protein
MSHVIPNADSIMRFVNENSMSVDGVGYVCSLSVGADMNDAYPPQQHML